MNLTDLQSRTLGIVSRRYKNNPITGKEIATKIGLKDRDTGKEGADIRSVINALRTKGYPICANSEGYYFAQYQTELNTFITSLQGRIDAQQKACDGLRAGFKHIGEIFPIPSDEEVPIRKVRFGNPEVWLVTGSNKKTREITIFHGVYSCDCEAYKFSRSKICKHIEKVKKSRKEEIKQQQEAAPKLF